MGPRAVKGEREGKGGLVEAWMAEARAAQAGHLRARFRMFTAGAPEGREVSDTSIVCAMVRPAQMSRGRRALVPKLRNSIELSQRRPYPGHCPPTPRADIMLV